MNRFDRVDGVHMIRPSVQSGRGLLDEPFEPRRSLELGHRLSPRFMWRQLWRLLPGPCALCGLRCHGSLCVACLRQLRASLWHPACRRCASPVPASAKEERAAEKGAQIETAGKAGANTGAGLEAKAEVKGEAGVEAEVEDEVEAEGGEELVCCSACRRDPPAQVRTIVAMAYQPPADTLILQLKVGRRHGRARTLADLLYLAWCEARPEVPWDAWVVPVPASPSALRSRGFNPAGEIAAELARQLRLTLRRDVLVWRSTCDQHSQRGRLRQARLQRREAFRVRLPCDSLQGRSIVLVDDVMTTGATLGGAAQALLQAGARQVLATAVARTPPPGWSTTGYAYR